MTDREKIEVAIRITLGLPKDHVLTDEDRRCVTWLALGGNQIVDVSLAGLRAALPGCKICI